MVTFKKRSEKRCVLECAVRRENVKGVFYESTTRNVRKLKLCLKPQSSKHQVL